MAYLTLNSNDSRVIELRDGAKVSYETGREFLRVFKEHSDLPSIFNFFDFMDNREKNYILPRRNPPMMMAPPPMVMNPENMLQQGSMVPGVPLDEIHLVKDESQMNFGFERSQDNWRNRPYVDQRYPKGPGHGGYYGPRRGGSGYGGQRGDYYGRRPYNGGNQGGRFPYKRGGPQPRYERKSQEGEYQPESHLYEPKEITKQADKKKKNIDRKTKDGEKPEEKEVLKP